MKGEKMRLGSLIVALLVLCVPTQVIAEVGQKPMAKTEGGSGNDARPETTKKSSTKNANTPSSSTNNPSGSGTNNPQTQAAAQICESEKQQVRAATHGGNDGDTGAIIAFMNGQIRHGKAELSDVCWSAKMSCEALFKNVEPASPFYRDALKEWEGIQKYKASQNSDNVIISQYLWFACIARETAARLSTTTEKPKNTAKPPSPSADIAANPSVNTPSEKLVKRAGPTQRAQDLREANALGEKHQDQVDRARRGKPKRHVVGAEASNCLTPQTGGGVVNSCPFAVEYSYCVFHPTKDSWSASFDCEKTKGGSWQIGPGPNSRSIMHTAGETTYWFACKYGPTLHKPDGISPADIEFQVGRGLLGRCAEWGAGGKS